MNFKGVDIEEDYVRIYPDGDYFAQIIGYTGIGSTEEIDELKAKDPSYEYGDTIGKSGIEALMETELSGKKGTKTVYLDSTGKVLEVLKETPAVVGNDVYLTIDHDLTIARTGNGKYHSYLSCKRGRRGSGRYRKDPCKEGIFSAFQQQYNITIKPFEKRGSMVGRQYQDIA